MNQLLSPSLRQEWAACSAAVPFDLLPFDLLAFAALMPEAVAAVLPEAARLEAARLGSEKLDPEPARASPSAPGGLGRRGTYGTTFGYPAETRFG